MSTRPKMEIRGVSTLWNATLGVFSIMGALRTWPEFLHVLSEHGIHHSLCIPSFIEKDRVAGYWTFMFVMSKVPELGDTIFIVLRKQPLIFLHWYHHITVLLYSWYAFKAMRFRVPRCLAMIITTLQLIQMVVGC